MDFLDSLDLETTNKRSNRVRSWYLYEQFKSLESNQLQAAQKLKDRSYQDRILRQELSERRTRRKICDQSGLCHSESKLVSGDKNFRNKTELSVNTNEYFESVCQLQETDELGEENILSENIFDEDDDLGCKCYTEEFKSVDDTKDDSYDESVTSVLENSISDENLSDDIINILKVDTNIAQNIHLQLEEAKENIQCIEKYTELAVGKISEDDGDHYTGELKSQKVGTDNKVAKEFESNLFTVWTRLVSFAYQLMQLNHGNCYYDYSSQFLTAVLACDVLCRGFSKMCNILQPYVSPIKFTTDESDVSVENLNNLDRKKTVKLKMSRNSFGKEFYLCGKPEPKKRKRSHFNKKFRSEECWRRHSKDSFGNSIKKWERASEPWRSISKQYTKQEVSEISSISSSIWPEFSKVDVSRSNRFRVCDCCWRREVENTMLKIARYMDNMLKELEKCNNM